MNNKNVKITKIENLYWKDVYTKWPNQEETAKEDQKLKIKRIEIQGKKIILYDSINETIKKVFFVLEL